MLAGPVLSQATEPEIVVTSGRTTEDLVAQVSADLGRQLFHASRSARREMGDGIAVVRFACGKDGKPGRIALYRQSGNADIDRAAVGAVERLSSFHPPPDGIAEGQLFQANIVFADSRREHDRLRRQLAREEAERFASSPAERAVLVFASGAPSKS